MDLRMNFSFTVGCGPNVYKIGDKGPLEERRMASLPHPIKVFRVNDSLSESLAPNKFIAVYGSQHQARGETVEEAVALLQKRLHARLNIQPSGRFQDGDNGPWFEFYPTSP